MEKNFHEKVKRAQKGDKEALLELIMEQKEDYYHLAYAFMKNPEDALDVLEDMILKVYENIHRLKKAEAFYSWSNTILVNCCKGSLRKKKKVIPFKELPEEAYVESFSEQDDLIAFESHLSGLNPKYQEVLRLRFLLDMEYEKIAQILEIPLGTVKSRIHTGLKKLRERLGVAGYE
ncbi:MAG: sigma-70 family RNA polymerase sigma factor [Desulfitobacterium sp.]|mgnify:CR=1 FL=1|nr:sigma-70 family RNA polymerase sigma factor [Desulfitobacterium sp.]